MVESLLDTLLGKLKNLVDSETVIGKQLSESRFQLVRQR